MFCPDLKVTHTVWSQWSQQLTLGLFVFLRICIVFVDCICVFSFWKFAHWILEICIPLPSTFSGKLVHLTFAPSYLKSCWTNLLVQHSLWSIICILYTFQAIHNLAPLICLICLPPPHTASGPSPPSGPLHLPPLSAPWERSRVPAALLPNSRSYSYRYCLLCPNLNSKVIFSRWPNFSTTFYFISFHLLILLLGVAFIYFQNYVFHFVKFWNCIIVIIDRQCWQLKTFNSLLKI